MHQELECFSDENKVEFFMLDVQDNHHLKIMVFDAKYYLENHQKSLHSYLYPKL